MQTRDLLDTALRERFANDPNAVILAAELTDDEWVWVQDQEPRLADQGPAVIERALDQLVRARRTYRPIPRAPRTGRTDRRPGGRERAVGRLFALDAVHNVADRAGVRAFRHTVLKGTLLTGGEVRTWMEHQQRAQGPSAPTSGRRRNTGGVRVPMLACRFPESEWISWIPTTPGSVLDRLRRTCEALSAFYGWHPAETTLFVLTGHEPQHQLIRMTVRHRLPMQARSRIVMEIDPMAPPTDVAEVYARTRRLHFGGRLRRLSPKHAALAVCELTHGAEGASRAMAQWNRSHPTLRYTSLSVFRRDCQQAVTRLREMSLRPSIPRLP